MRLFAGRVVGIGVGIGAALDAWRDVSCDAVLDAGRDVSCDAVLEGGGIGVALDAGRVVGCGMIRVIVWEYVGDIFGEVDLKILHIVAKNSSRHF